MKQEKQTIWLVGIVALIAIIGVVMMTLGESDVQTNSAGEAFRTSFFSRASTTTTTPVRSEPTNSLSTQVKPTSQEPMTTETPTTGEGRIPTGIECDYTGTIVPFNQGLLDYTVWSDASNPDSENKVAMSRRFSMIDKELASNYLILNDLGSNELDDVVFSKFEYYACMMPDWFYQKLDGLYLAKYMDENVARSSVLVMKDRESAEYVAQLLLALSGPELEFKTINGNYVAYTAQKAYWWTHENMIIRVASHTTPIKADAYGITQEPSHDFSICETLDVLDDMVMADCIHDQFWRDVPTDILYAYLVKHPSDAEEIDWPEEGQFAQLAAEMNWPSEDESGEYQWGCDPERNKGINEAFASMSGEFSKEAQQAKTASRIEDVVKITKATTDKRWYYLGETISISSTAVSLDNEQGTVIAEVNDDIFPHPETTSIAMRSSECGDRVTYTEKMTGIKRR